jgi:hypothetical protein
VYPDAHDVRRPGLLLQYAIVVDDDDEAPLTWTFLEVAFADKKGYVDLSGTFYDRLQRQSGPTSVAFEISRRRRAM